MKPIKFLMASALVGLSIFSLSACKKEPNVVIINIDGTQTTVELEGKDAIPAKPQDPVKEGWIFRGWYLDPAGETPYDFDKVLDSGSTVYAVFDEKEYNVTFVVDGVPNVVTFKWSQTPSIETPKKDKYVFKTWCLDAECNAPYTFTAPTREGMTVYAKFVEAYKVNYVVAPKMTDEEIENNTEIVETEKQTPPIKPADPNEEGYNFEGWFLDKNFKTACNFDKVLNEGQTIYAKLVEKQYEITYKVARTDDVLSTVTYNYWTAPTQPETPYYNGEWFFGWYLDKECTNSYDFSYTLKENTVIYGQFMVTKEISTVEELIAIKDYPAGNYTLMNDITFGWETWEQIPAFSGTFDGNGHKIYDFTMSTTTADSGFFVINNGTVKNLTLENFSFTSNCGGSSSVGSLVGKNNGTVENCTINNHNEDNDQGITYKNISENSGQTANYGALIGLNSATGIVKNCTINAGMEFEQNFGATNWNNRYTVWADATTNFGGAVGQNQGSVSKVSVDVALSSSCSAWGAGGAYSDEHDYGRLYFHFGGVVAENGGIITQSDSKVKVNAYVSPGTRGYLYGYGGGMVANNSGTITESVAKGEIVFSGSSASTCDVGGFVRYNRATGVIDDSYSDLSIKTTIATGGYIGGFVAYNEKEVNRCYALGSIDTTCTGSVGGFVGYMGTNAQIKTSFTVVNIKTNASKLGAFVGDVESAISSMTGCYYSSDAVVMKGEQVYVSVEVTGIKVGTTAELYSENILKTKMYWNFKVNAWKIDGTNAPTLLWQNA